MTGTTHIPSIKQAQQRLELWAQAEGQGLALPRFGADGLGGNETRAAILAFQTRHGIVRSGQFDQATVNLLFSAPPSSGHVLAKDIGLGILSVVINQVLKGTGIQMDFAKISKAIAGGITAAIAATGTMAVVYLQLPPDAQTHFPSFVYSVLPWVNEVIGFLVGFCGVYFAPANKG